MRNFNLRWVRDAEVLLWHKIAIAPVAVVFLLESLNELVEQTAKEVTLRQNEIKLLSTGAACVRRQINSVLHEVLPGTFSS